MRLGNGRFDSTFMKSATTRSPIRRTDTRPSVSRSRDLDATKPGRYFLVLGFVLALNAVACTDLLGNDPNVPDYAGALAAEDASVTIACNASVPKSCPNAPSYANEIAPLVKRSCVTCHAINGSASDRDLTTYKNLTNLETTSLVQVEDCLMPPSDAGPDAMLSPEDRTELLQWFVCGSPNN
jgi:hypothetical protein